MWPERNLPLPLASLIIAGLASLAVWIAVESLTAAGLLGLPIAVGAAMLYLQVRASGVVRNAERERDEVLPLLQSATPKLRMGLQPEEAFLAATRETTTRAGEEIADYCVRVREGIEGAARVSGSGVMVQTIISLLRAVRENGGEAARPFESLAEMIEADQRLRRKQQIATLHVRAQANALVGIAVIILGLALFGSASSLNFLRETQDGRLMVLFAATSMLWGYLAIAVLTARISRV